MAKYPKVKKRSIFLTKLLTSFFNINNLWDGKFPLERKWDEILNFVVFHWHDDAWSHIKSTFMSKGYRNIIYSPVTQAKKEYRWDIMLRCENIPFFFKPGLWNKKKKMLKIVYQHRRSNVLHVYRYIKKMYIFGPYIPVRCYYWHYDFVWFGLVFFHTFKENYSLSNVRYQW